MSVCVLFRKWKSRRRQELSSGGHGLYQGELRDPAFFTLRTISWVWILFDPFLRQSCRPESLTSCATRLIGSGGGSKLCRHYLLVLFAPGQTRTSSQTAMWEAQLRDVQVLPFLSTAFQLEPTLPRIPPLALVAGTTRSRV